MALENEDLVRQLLAGRPRPELPEDFTRTVMRRVKQQEQARGHRVGARLVLAAYWLVALVASAWIVRQPPLLKWAGAVLWCAALVLVPAGYAFALWSRPEAVASRGRG
jgi:hypothetical protein